MSSHICKMLNGQQEIKTILGWSTHHQCYYLTLIKQGDSDDNPTYCSLIHEPEHKPQTLEYFINMLQDQHVYLPDAMIREIEAEVHTQVEHKTVEHILINDNYMRYVLN